MDIKHITSDSLRRLLSLTDKKEQLINAVADIESEIAKTLKGAATTVVEAAEAVTPFKPARKAKKAKGTKSSGGLKERILALLEAAGDEGLRVKDIAEKLGSKAGNISVWFSTTGKDITTKVQPGRYAVKGVKPAASVPKAAKPAKRKSKISPEGRARIAAATKARWAARRAAKTAVKPAAKPAKKGFKLPKAK
jgi:DNA-binding MarR family transcriptional regulator